MTAGSSVAAVVVSLADLVMLACAGYLLVWAVGVAGDAWPKYWALTVITGLVCVGFSIGVAGAIILALPKGHQEGVGFTLRRVAWYLAVPAVVGLVLSVVSLVVVLITIPSIY